MSSKKLAYLLMVLIVCGFITGGTAHGQSSEIYIVQGVITKSDGTPAAGLVMKADRILFTEVNAVEDRTQDDGSYKLTLFSFPFPPDPIPKIGVGEQIEITVTDGGNVVAREVHTIRDENINRPVAGVTIPITLSDITVEAAPSELNADGDSTSKITVKIGGTGRTGDTVTIDPPDKGTVSAITEEGDGVYTATYTAPPLDLSFPDTVQITASSANTSVSAHTFITLLPVPTTVSVAVVPSIFSADTPSPGAVLVTVDRSSGRVADEIVTLTLNPEVGSVSAVTNNGDGTYSATYTSGGTAENVTLTALATQANVSGMANIVISAGLPTEIELSATPETVSSRSSSTITAVVTDSNGNRVGDLTLTPTTTSGGTVSEFTSTAVGTYTATYVAPMVAMGAEGPETITVSSDGISADITLELTSELPIPVDFLELGGTVYKKDGQITADRGVTVMIVVGSNSDTDTTDEDGSYGVAFPGFGTKVATTGDMVSVAVTDADGNAVSVDMMNVNGVAVSGGEFPLINDILEKVKAGEPVTVDVTTNIVIPPRSVGSLTVKGTVFKEDGTTAAGGGLDVEVTVGSETLMRTTNADGSYSAAFLGFGRKVATTGDMLSVVVSDSSGERRGENNMPFSNIDLGEGDHADVERNVETNIGLTSNALSVLGTVFLKNGDTPCSGNE